MKKCFLILTAVLSLGFSGIAQIVTDSIIVPSEKFVVTENKPFVVRSENGNIVLLKIYNRWGKEVFSVEGSVCSWNCYSSDGKRVPDGIYDYVAEIKIREISSKIIKKKKIKTEIIKEETIATKKGTITVVTQR